MRTKKLIAVLAAAAMVSLGACSGEKGPDTEKLIDNPSDNLNATGMPIVKEPITIKFMSSRPVGTAEDWNTVASMKKMEELTNIHIEWGPVPSESIEEKRNLALASGDYPEVLYRSTISNLDLSKYGEQGTFVKVNTLIDKYMPNLKKLLEERPDVKKGITFPDGGIYAFPDMYDPEFSSLVDGGNKFWIRQDWLKALDMKIPTTTDEYYAYLKAVKSTDLNGNGKKDEIPFGGKYEMGALTHALKGAFGVGNRGIAHSYIDIDPGTDKVRFFPIADGYKEMLQFEHKLYAEGLIEKNIYSIDPGKVQAAAGEGIYGSLINQAPGPLFGGKGKEFVAIPPLKGPNGDDQWNYRSSPLVAAGRMVITDKNEHPIETARWMDHFYGDEGAKLFFMGLEGESFEKTEDGPRFLKKITDNPDGLSLDEALKPYVIYMGGGYPGVVKQEYFQGAENTPQALKAHKVIAPKAKGEVWPKFTYTNEENDLLSGAAVDIEKYVDESRDKFITGKLSFDEWDSYISTLQEMGLDDYVKINEAAYARYADR